jgi:glycosidase
VKPTIFSLLFVVLVSACSGGGGSGSGSDTFNIHSTEGSTQNRLICNRGSYQVACDLRIYQIMVESFIDGDAAHDYNTGYGTSHHRGDLQGIINALDYIQSLGMNAIWLTPVFHSIARPGQQDWEDRLDATGYFTSDYFDIDPGFGTLEQARDLVEAAHQKGLYVFFDGVFGHHKENVVASPMGRTPSNGTPQADGYEAIYPDDLEFYQEVASYWINELKIDGWRLDQAYQIPLEYWDDIRNTVEQSSAGVTYTNHLGQTVHPLGYMVAEVWDSRSQIIQHAYGSENNPALASAFAFPMRYSLVQTLAVEESGFGSLDTSRLDASFAGQQDYPPHAMPNLMLGNHDLVRFGDLLQRGQLAQPDQDEYWQRHKLALSFLGAYSGPITLYYNDEIGAQLEGFDQRLTCDSSTAEQGLCDDHVSRTSAVIEGIATTLMDSPAVLTTGQSDLKQYVQALMALRQTHPAMANGARTHIYSGAGVYVDRKDAGGDHLLYLMNANHRQVTLNIDGTAIGSIGDLTDLYDSSLIAQQADAYEMTLPAFSARFYSIENSSW